jgi:hypothetical protein
VDRLECDDIGTTVVRSRGLVCPTSKGDAGDGRWEVMFTHVSVILSAAEGKCIQ